MSIICDLKNRIIKLEYLLENLPAGAGIDRYITGGVIVGRALVLNRTPNGTINIPLSGVELAINFDNLSQLQKNALNNCIKGDLIQDAFGVDLGYLLNL